MRVKQESMGAKLQDKAISLFGGDSFLTGLVLVLVLVLVPVYFRRLNSSIFNGVLYISIVVVFYFLYLLRNKNSRSCFTMRGAEDLEIRLEYRPVPVPVLVAE